MEESRARLLEHMFRRCWAMCFIILIVLNLPLSMFNLIAVYLLFRLGNSSCFEEQRLPSLLFSLKVGDVQRNDPDVTDENLENPKSLDENLDKNLENPTENMENLDENKKNLDEITDVTTTENFWVPDFPPHGNRKIAPKYKGWDKVNPNPYPDINKDCLCKCVTDPEYVCDCDE